MDFIIVGQGLAGSLLAYVLDTHGCSVQIYDEPRQDSSSRVAAGIYNPITGRKMVKTWNADKYFPMIEPFYNEMEKTLGKRFIYPTNIYRPFVSFDEQNDWQGKLADPRFSRYIKSVFSQSSVDNVNDPYGGLLLNFSGYVDIPVMLDAISSYFEARQKITYEHFDSGDLKIGRNGGHYRGISASKVVFCTGIYHHKLFELPLRLVKGEILEINSSFKTEYIINRGVFVLPRGNGIYRVGSTYNHHDLSTQLSVSGRQYLEERLGNLISTGYEVTGGVAGVRPTSPDRRPIIGLLEQTPEVGIFNGFGTKGVSLVPYYATHFKDVLLNGQELDPEVNITRYFSLS